MTLMTPRERVLIAIAAVGAALYVAALIVAWCVQRGSP